MQTLTKELPMTLSRYDLFRSQLHRTWTAETSASPQSWSQDNAAVGQADVTVLVAQDVFGGDIGRAQVQLPDGSQVMHWFGLDVNTVLDFTLGQFPAGSSIDYYNAVMTSEPFKSTREALLSNEATRQRYNLLKTALIQPNLTPEQKQIVALESYALGRGFFDESWGTTFMKRTFAKVMELCVPDGYSMGVHARWSSHNPTAVYVYRNGLATYRTDPLGDLPLTGDLAQALLADLREAAAHRARKDIVSERERELDRQAEARVLELATNAVELAQYFEAAA